MFRNLFSPRLIGVTLEDAIELANNYMEITRKEYIPSKALNLIRDAKSRIKDAERIFVATRAGSPALNDSIASAYHEHGKLLEELGYHRMARKSHRKAAKWGYTQAVNQPVDSSRPDSPSSPIYRSLCPIVALSVTPHVALAVNNASLVSGATKLTRQSAADNTNLDEIENPDVTQPTRMDSNNTQIADHDSPEINVTATQPPRTIFLQNVTPPVAKYNLPEDGERISSTTQLAYCLRLLQPSLTSNEDLDETERDWSQTKTSDPIERERLMTLATDLIRAFVRDELKKQDVVAEVVSLAAVLDQDDFRKLLQIFVDGIERSVLLETHTLDGLAQLVRNSSQGYIDSDDLVKILSLLNTRLRDTHEQSTGHIFGLALAMSRVLDSMVDIHVKDLDRKLLHEPLSEYLKQLQENSDPFLVYQAAYACQALQYVPDDETILRSMLRRTGKVIKGISGVVSAVVALDLNRFIEELQSIQDGLVGVGKAIELVKGTYSSAARLAESGQELRKILKEGFGFTRKTAWYPALRGLDALLQDGRFAEFEELVRGAPCRTDPAFQWGVCQRLSELAFNAAWDESIRQCAVTFLEELYRDDATWSQHVCIKQWILRILDQLANSSKGIFAKRVRALTQELKMDSSTEKQALYHTSKRERVEPYPMPVTLMPQESPLLYCIQNRTDVEVPLRQLKRERLMNRGGEVYISPRAKTNQRATKDFDLTFKVEEFLNSKRKVFLVLGDSGAGKSTFSRALEISLWDRYDNTNGPIPLFIHLPAIDKPEQDLIKKQLRRLDFTDNAIKELRSSREFILICDGYDESQQIRNLYTSNQLNQPGGWRAQMVISCRTEYTGIDYEDCFWPTDRNSGGKSELFQEAIIQPFNKDQIQDYINQFVHIRESLWEPNSYIQVLKQIPNLWDLVKNPFLLKLALEVLPRLLDLSSKSPWPRITRIQLYDEFIAQWIDRGKIRLMDMELNSRDKIAFKELSDSGLRQHGIAYLKELATAIYDNQSGHPMVTYSEHRDLKTWKEPFFSKNGGRHLLREIIPLNRDGDQYRFVHKSLVEYGLSLAVFDPNAYGEGGGGPLKPSLSRCGTTFSALSFEMKAPEVEDVADTEPSLLNSPLGRRNLVNESPVLLFLVERVKQQSVFKDQLLAAIERSKTDKSSRIAAVNAITILVKARVQFNGADLRGIQIPGADLNHGVFDSALLEGADLRKANLRNIWLRAANLDGADITGVQFGELPFLQQDSQVDCSAISPDGETYAIGLWSGDIILYETSNWNRVQSWKGHSQNIKYLAFSATSDQIASRGNDAILRLWDVKTGDCIHALPSVSFNVDCVAYSPDGEKIVSACEDRAIRLWDTKSGECIHTLYHKSLVDCVSFSPNGNRIASSMNNTLLVWNVETGDLLQVLHGHNRWIGSVTFSPKGGQVASGGRDMTVRLWDVEIGVCMHNLQGHSDSITSIMYSPKEPQIASGSDDKTVRLWDTSTGNCLRILRGHTLSDIRVLYSPKGDQIATQSRDTTVRLWDAETGNCVHILQGHSEKVTSIVYSLKGDQIISGSWDETVRLWDAAAGNGLLNSLDNGNVDDDQPWESKADIFNRTLQRDRSIISIRVSRDGSQVATGSIDGTLRLWDVGTGNCIHILQSRQDAYIRTIRYSAKGSWIATGDDSGVVKLWNAETASCIHALLGHCDSITTVVFSPKEDQIASSSVDKTVRIWSTENGSCIHVLQDYGDSVIEYSPNGDRIASGCSDGILRFWDVGTGECVLTLQGNCSFISSIKHSPEGDQIAVGSTERIVRLWSIEDGQCLTTISGFNGYVVGMFWGKTFDGYRLFTRCDDRSMYCWQIIKEQDSYRALLDWSSSHEGLAVSGASFKDVHGLNQLTWRLLTQRGALIPAYTSPE